MKHLGVISLIFFLTTIFVSCKNSTENPVIPAPEATTLISGKAVIKVLPCSGGWISLQETLQSQYLIEQPKREISWRDENLSEVASYAPPDGWSLVDAITHPSGQVTASIIKVNPQQGDSMEIKLLRFKAGSLIAEQKIHPISLSNPHPFYFPVSLDRIKLVPYGEGLYLIARWDQNEVIAYKLGFGKWLFQIEWEKLVEPPSYVESVGIIGGGFDNFHQGDRFIRIHAGVDSQGNVYIVVPSGEEIISAHDSWFHENLSAGTVPGNYDFGVAILTKFSPQGDRMYAKLEGQSRSKQLINIRVSDHAVYLFGRIKTGTGPESWDAWLLTTDTQGNVVAENNIDIKNGDMFWDLCPLSNGEVLAVGTINYTQNPSGLSVSDTRQAEAVVLDPQGKILQEIILPQGPSDRGSEAMSVTFRDGNAVFAGAHNAPGTHAPVYSDGFIAIRNYSHR